MRWGLALGMLLGSLLAATGCQDLRDFRGTWTGSRVGDEPVRRGFDEDVQATLEIERIDLQTMVGRLSTNDDRFARAPIAPVTGAEADVLSTISFDGAPVRVFLSFVEASDGGGDALAVVSLYADDRVELRIMRGGDLPLYGIFPLSHTEP